MKNLERKLAIKQKIIDRQNETIKQLQEENENLKFELEFEVARPKEGYEQAKALIVNLEQHIHDYEIALMDLKKSKDYYDKISRELLELKGKYKRDMDRFMKKMSNHN